MSTPSVRSISAWSRRAYSTAGRAAARSSPPRLPGHRRSPQSPPMRRAPRTRPGASRARGPRRGAAALYVSPASRPAPANVEAEQRRLLREQIATLDRTLIEMEARYPGAAPVPAETRDAVAPRLLSLSELERVQTNLVRRLSIVQAAIDQLETEEIVVEEEPVTAPSSDRAARARPNTRPAPAGA